MMINFKANQITFSVLLNFIFLVYGQVIHAQGQLEFQGLSFTLGEEMAFPGDVYYKIEGNEDIVAFLILRSDGLLVEFDNRDATYNKYYFDACPAEQHNSTNNFIYLRYFRDQQKNELVSQNFMGDLPGGDVVLFTNSVSSHVTLKESSFDEVLRNIGAVGYPLFRSPRKRSLSTAAEKLKDILTSDGYFYDNLSSKWFFNDDGSLRLVRSSDNSSFDGYYDIMSVTYDDDFQTTDGDSYTFDIFTLYVGFKKYQHIISWSASEISNEGILSLGMYFLGGDINNAKPIFLWKDIGNTTFNWSEITGESRFLSTVDLLARGWLAFIVEECLRQSDQEEALQYALDQLLSFPDKDRSFYGDILRQAIIQKYRNKH